METISHYMLDLCVDTSVSFNKLFINDITTITVQYFFFMIYNYIHHFIYSIYIPYW